MNYFLNFINALLVFGSIQGIILGFLLFYRKGNIIANRILAIISFILSFIILLDTFSEYKIIPFFDIHELTINVSVLFLTPLIFFYTKALTVYRFKFKKNDIFSFIPFIFSLILYIPCLFSLYPPEIYEFINVLINYMSFSVFFISIFLSNVSLVIYSKMIKNNYSALEKINLNWLRIFIFSLTLLWIYTTIIDIFFEDINRDLIWLVCTAFLYLICYFGFMQPEIFSSPIISFDDVKKFKKYEKSSLTSESAENYLAKLNLSMTEQKYFLNSDLSLSGLSQKMGIPIHHLSQIINDKLGLNFYDYINSKRIEEAKRSLIDSNFIHQNIASIGFEVGFNTLSAFNKAFKKFTHKTPSQFRNENHK